MTSTTTSTNTARPKTTGRQPSEQAIDAAIDSATRLLRLPTFRDRYSEFADSAGREQLSYRAFLSELLLAECDDREQRRAARPPRRRGRLPPPQEPRGLRLRREHRDQPGDDQHPGWLRLGQRNYSAASGRVTGVAS